MEINKKLHKLLDSKDKTNNQIALEILKKQNYTDFEYLVYNYRYTAMTSSTLYEYFEFTLTENPKPCLGKDGQSTETGLKIQSWK